LFISCILVCLIWGSFIYYKNVELKETWETKYKEGHLKDLILYNNFPNNELFITFTDGNYTVITENRFWAYAHLSVVDTNNIVNLTYKENGYGRTNLIKVQERKI